MAPHIKIGQRIEIKDPLSLGDWYSTRIEDITETSMAIGAPMKGGVLVPIAVGSTVVAQFPQEDAFYSFSSELLQRRTGDLPMLVLRRPTQFDRVQRRRLYRLQVNLDVVYTVAGAKEGKKAVTVDISGGGVCLTAAEKVEPGLELDLEILLDRAGSITAHGCVVKCSELDTAGGKPRYSLGIEFMNLPGPVQEQIVSFIFAKQRERRQREMGV